MQYLYNDDSDYFFMNTESFEQISIPKDIMSNNTMWLKGEELCSITFFNNNPIGIELPIFVELMIKHSEPGLKGDTTSKATKSAVLETDATIQVPLFVNENDVVKIDTRSKEYVSRVKA